MTNDEESTPGRVKLSVCTINGKQRIELVFGLEGFLFTEQAAADLGKQLINLVMQLREERGETSNVL